MPTLRDRFAAARAGWKSGRSVPPVRRSQSAPQWTVSNLRPRRKRAITGAGRGGGSGAPPPAQPQSRAQTIFQAITALTAVAALLFTARSLDLTAEATKATRDQVNLAAQGQVAERFSQAIDQLGQAGPDKLSIRLGGIYSLEQLMFDAPDREPTVIEVLCAFVRTNAHKPDKKIEPSELTPAPEDVRAAITVLARRPNPDQARNRLLDFSGTQLSLPRISLPNAHLAKADLEVANLSGANLYGADLSSANLSSANLRGANLSSANLYGVNLSGADLSGADLGVADLHRADLHSANLSRTYLYGADLTDADLRNADLTLAFLGAANLTDADLRNANLTRAFLSSADLGNADLRGVDLTGAELRGTNLSSVRNLTSEMVRCTYVNDETQLPPGVTRPVEVPPGKPLPC